MHTMLILSNPVWKRKLPRCNALCHLSLFQRRRNVPQQVITPIGSKQCDGERQVLGVVGD